MKWNNYFEIADYKNIFVTNLLSCKRTQKVSIVFNITYIIITVLSYISLLTLFMWNALDIFILPFYTSDSHRLHFHDFNTV